MSFDQESGKHPLEPATTTARRSPRKKRRVLLAVAFALTAAPVAAFLLPRDLDSGPLVERLLAAKGRTPFATVMPNHGWDTVCYLDPYSRPSKSLPRHMNENLSRLGYRPDRYLDEEEVGIAFINHAGKEVFTYIIPQRHIYQIKGIRCLRRGQAAFLLNEIAASNWKYKILQFIRMD